ncbi:hypothetical protein FC756_09085 [Lysinibacillus mangiferihumi]|uniref:Uncharacterized protein n=1 Tax=Lysinibacillus mangiferihumi TaxID=1130819 RepID=A0A4U2Z6A5_9BACI|nr:hypothetical protein FC756_09085 [Lysinibacillus mangiferihumi]
MHKGRHNRDYDSFISLKLDEIEALNANNDVKRMHLNDIIENIGDDLQKKRKDVRHERIHY